jgi:FdhD protein
MTEVSVKKIGPAGIAAAEDSLVTEEPLGLRLAWMTGDGEVVHDIAVTMRTPANDFDLALGFLFTEGFIGSVDQVAGIAWETDTKGVEQSNSLKVSLHAAPEVDPAALQRNFFVTSSCGICGKASIDAISAQAPFPVRGESLRVSAESLNRLPEQLTAGQRIFAGTGSIHAAALFDADGLTGDIYEDVGRHNAVDKLIGANLRAAKLPLWNFGVIVSGRASFELVQKARMAGIPMLVAVGAPSSLAVELAWESRMTLAGFLRDGRFNVYAGPARIVTGD